MQLFEAKNITGSVGGGDSQLGHLAIGYDENDYSVVIMTGWKFIDNYTEEIDFGADAGSNQIVLKKGIPTVLTRNQMLQAIDMGAIMTIVSFG